jgi:hypothetical protein
MKTIKTKAASIAATEIATVAAQGVQRALESRKCAMQELSAEEAGQVGGALALPDKIFIYGYWRDLINVGVGGYDVPVNQTLGAKTLGM